MEGFDGDLFALLEEVLIFIHVEEPSTDNVGAGDEVAVGFIDNEHDHDHAVFSEVFSIAQDDIIQANIPSIDEDPADGHVSAPGCSVGVHLDDVAVLEDENLFGVDAHFHPQMFVLNLMAELAVDGDEILGFSEGDHGPHFLAVGVAGHMDSLGDILIVNLGSPAEEVVDHTIDGFFVAGNDAGRENHDVFSLDFYVAVFVEGHTAERAKGLALAAGAENEALFGRGFADIADIVEDAGGIFQDADFEADPQVAQHVEACSKNFAVCFSCNFENNLNSVEGGGETGDDDGAGGTLDEFCERLPDIAFAAGMAFAFDIGAVAEKSEDAFFAILSEGLEIETFTVGRGHIDFVIAGVDDVSEGEAEGQGKTLGHGVGDMEELNAEGAEVSNIAGFDFNESSGAVEAVFFEAFADHSAGKATGVDWSLNMMKEVGKGADMVFVGVSDQNGADAVGVIHNIVDIGDDHVDAGEFFIWDHLSAIDDIDFVGVLVEHHIHANVAESTEGNDADFALVSWRTTGGLWLSCGCSGCFGGRSGRFWGKGRHGKHR